MSDGSLEALLARLRAPEILANPQMIATILSSVAKRDDSAQMLKGSLQNNLDPLEQLIPAELTLPYLYILSVILFAIAARRFT